jgi:hypothetical protein
MYPPSGEHYSHDTLEAFALRSYLQMLYKAAQDKDNAEIDTNVSMGSLSRGMSREFYVVACPEGDPALPTAFDRMVWEPKHEDVDIESGEVEMPAIDFEKIIVKIPRLMKEQEFVKLPEGVDYWNDMVIEVYEKGGALYRYLFNSQGIEPFHDRESLDESLNTEEPYEEEVDDDSYNNGDLFSVRPEHDAWNTPPLTVTALQALFDKCEMQRQPNE